MLDSCLGLSRAFPLRRESSDLISQTGLEHKLLCASSKFIFGYGFLGFHSLWKRTILEMLCEGFECMFKLPNPSFDSITFCRYPLSTAFLEFWVGSEISNTVRYFPTKFICRRFSTRNKLRECLCKSGPVDFA